MTGELRLVPCGDRSVLVYVGDRIDPEINQKVHQLAHALRQAAHPAVVEVTPSYHCLMIEYDPLRLPPEQLGELIQAAEQNAREIQVDSAIVEIPVCYGGEYGPDLSDVATHTGISVGEVVRRHTEPEYRVYALGFSPGFPYLGDLDPRLHTPRLEEPRIKVPAGSVGIGGGQTGIYPDTSPGGWRVIGRTPVRLFDPTRTPPALLAPGNTVRFVPITPEEFVELERSAPSPERTLPRYEDGQAGLRVIQPGAMTTVQDLGRRGYMAYGVPVGGAADYWSLMVGNWLLGNRARAAALEITLTGPEVEFTGAVAFCVTGAAIPATLIPADGGSPQAVPGWTTLLAGPGDRLRFGTVTAGCRSYLCLAGGIDLPPIMGSLSEDLFGKIGPFGRRLQPGDWLPVGLPLVAPADVAGRTLPADAVPGYPGEAVIRVTRGPQAEAFDPEALDTFFRETYTVGHRSDRQGLRLQGSPLSHRMGSDILSEPIPPGSVQVPANGQPILLLSNRQTIGGYTKVATAVYPDLAMAAQLRPGDRIRFTEVDQSEAHAIAWAERRRLAQVRRYLREVAARRENVAFTITAPPAPAQPKPSEPVAEQPARAARAARRFRIRISGVEFDTIVEEV